MKATYNNNGVRVKVAAKQIEDDANVEVKIFNRLKHSSHEHLVKYYGTEQEEDSVNR